MTSSLCVMHTVIKECFHYFFVAYSNGWKPMHKRYNSRSELYHVCASVYIHFCMQRKNNENIPYNLITNKK